MVSQSRTWKEHFFPDNYRHSGVRWNVRYRSNSVIVSQTADQDDQFQFPAETG